MCTDSTSTDDLLFKVFCVDDERDKVYNMKIRLDLVYGSIKDFTEILFSSDSRNPDDPKFAQAQKIMAKFEEMFSCVFAQEFTDLNANPELSTKF